YQVEGAGVLAGEYAVAVHAVTAGGAAVGGQRTAEPRRGLEDDDVLPLYSGIAYQERRTGQRCYAAADQVIFAQPPRRFGGRRLPATRPRGTPALEGTTSRC